MKIHIGLLAVLAVSPAFGQQPEKRRVAVMDFDYATVMTSVQAVFGTNQDIGKGISLMLINQLSNDGAYRLFERQQLDKILQEQNFSNSNRADPTTAAKIGKLAGVDIIITGAITQFGRDDKNIGGGGGGGHWGGYGLGGIGVKKAKAIVEITARLVDVNTGEILGSVTGHGESQRSGTNLLGGGGDWRGGGGGAFDMGSSNFGSTIIGEATKAAVSQVGTGLDQKAATLPKQVVPVVEVNGVVADATGNDIVINVGTTGGVHVGDKLSITRVSKVIKDPVTGKPIRSIESPIGTLTVTSADAGSAVGTFSGSGQPKVGDTVKNLQQ
ncbi:MAG: curli production assembly protein CsgG [Acidobacteriaceae bacterium]|nr:curli production assembly protein CsgG [Acidobacteriaceae bacterium]